jgi:hypothetical protein
MVGNSVTTFPAKLTFKIGDIVTKMSLKQGYTPAEKKSNSSFFSAVDSGMLDNNTHWGSVVGYLLVNLLTGKPLSTVNSGRGLILKKLFGIKGLTEFSITLIGFNVGGNSSPTDLTLNLKELKHLLEFYATRAQTILDLPEKTGGIRERGGHSPALQFGDVEDI